MLGRVFHYSWKVSVFLLYKLLQMQQHKTIPSYYLTTLQVRGWTQSLQAKIKGLLAELHSSLEALGRFCFHWCRLLATFSPLGWQGWDTHSPAGYHQSLFLEPFACSPWLLEFCFQSVHVAPTSQKQQRCLQSFSRFEPRWLLLPAREGALLSRVPVVRLDPSG